MQSLPSMPALAASGMQSQKPTLSTDVSCAVSAASTLPGQDRKIKKVKAVRGGFM